MTVHITPEEARRLYDEGKTVRQIAEMYGCEATTIRQRLKHTGVEFVSCKKPKYCKGAILCDLLCHDTMQEIKDRYGMKSFDTVERVKKKFCKDVKSRSRSDLDIDAICYGHDFTKENAKEFCLNNGIPYEAFRSQARRRGVKFMSRSDASKAVALKMNQQYESEKMKRHVEHAGDRFEVLSLESDYNVKLKCNTCGNVFTRKECHDFWRCSIRCDVCAEKDREERRAAKERETLARHYEQAERIIMAPPPYKYECMDRSEVQKCKVCGREYTENDWIMKYRAKGNGRRHTCCSPRCSAKRDDSSRSNGYKKTIPWESVASHYGTYCCYICGEPVNPFDYYVAESGQIVAGETYPSTDHVVPWSESHDGSMENSRLAHRGCNSMKGTKALKDALSTL